VREKEKERITGRKFKLNRDKRQLRGNRLPGAAARDAKKGEPVLEEKNG